MSVSLKKLRPALVEMLNECRDDSERVILLLAHVAIEAEQNEKRTMMVNKLTREVNSLINEGRRYEDA